jgi:hypothetical protein
MEGSRQILLHSQFGRERSAEVGRETGVSIRDHFDGESEPSVDVIKV